MEFPFIWAVQDGAYSLATCIAKTYALPEATHIECLYQVAKRGDAKAVRFLLAYFKFKALDLTGTGNFRIHAHPNFNECKLDSIVMAALASGSKETVNAIVNYNRPVKLTD